MIETSIHPGFDLIGFQSQIEEDDRQSLSLTRPLLDGAAVILRDQPQHPAADPLGRRSLADLPNVSRKDASPRLLDPLDNLGLNDERAEQAVEVGHDDHGGGTALDCLHSGSQALSSGKGSPARNVDLLMDGQELQALGIADGLDPLLLLLDAEGVFASLRLPCNANRSDAARHYRSKEERWTRKSVRPLRTLFTRPLKLAKTPRRLSLRSLTSSKRPSSPSISSDTASIPRIEDDPTGESA